MSRHRATYIPQMDAPSPILGFSLIGMFLAVVWAGIGYLVGALFGFPS